MNMNCDADFQLTSFRNSLKKKKKNLVKGWPNGSVCFVRAELEQSPTLLQPMYLYMSMPRETKGCFAPAFECNFTVRSFFFEEGS